MSELAIVPLAAAHISQLPSLILGYTTSEKYRIERQETPEEVVFRLQLIRLPEPVRISYSHLDETELARYAGLANNGCCFVALNEEQLVGVVIAEPQAWNNVLNVWEFHVAPDFQRRGVGRLLMGRLVETAVSLQLRALMCETQSLNVPAIRFYRKMGFTLDGIDLSYYTNEDYDPTQNVAIFMKYKIPDVGK
ncbi:MAG: GNAT family N-acetyltransferase [Ardenticatenaceae bacterium]|nr:GNAT family N-acetyltransferase [Ardenticatenaceae bacterium]MCB8946416.1 GNAT family N-acetyltransferase [Ardenticatenaceae bacterium]